MRRADKQNFIKQFPSRQRMLPGWYLYILQLHDKMQKNRRTKFAYDKGGFQHEKKMADISFRCGNFTVDGLSLEKLRVFVRERAFGK